MKKLLMAVLLPIAASAETVRLDIEVKDYDGNPLERVTVECASKKRPLLPWAKSEYKNMLWKTDKAGKVCESFDCFEGFAHCWFTAEGYYPEEFQDISFRANYDDKSDKMIFSEVSKKLEVKLRKIVNPVPMVKHSIWKGDKHLPSKNGRYGFDLKAGDWIAPHGGGQIPDMYVFIDWKEDAKVRSCTGLVEFVGKDCGAYIRHKYSCEKFPVDYSADENEQYQKSFPFSFSRDMVTDVYQELKIMKDDEYLVVRSRVEHDKQGALIGAHYTHIQGPIGVGRSLCLGDVYFNPRVNDTNLEYDQGLKPKTHIASQVKNDGNFR